MKSYAFNFRLIIPSTKKELKLYYDLRFEVLRKAWNQPKKSVKDEWEDISLHVLMLNEDNEAIATGRLQFNSDQEGQIRSMAVKEGYRNIGLGTQVLRFLEVKALEKKLTRIILDARDKAVHFYERNGYEIEGPSYTLFDEIPHMKMTKQLIQKN
jgi:predicted GNAT family N-acyltransferase